MPISFNNIPNNLRTPGVFTELDNSRALQGLVQNPHRALIIGQRIAAGSVSTDSLQAITRENLADGFFGPGSLLARMCNTFKSNNPNLELHALAISDAAAGVAASGAISFSANASVTVAGSFNLLINGKKVYTTLTSAWSIPDIASAVVATVNSDSSLPVTASTNAGSDLNFIAVNVGEWTNDIDIRLNYFTGESNPVGVLVSAVTEMAGGANNPDLDDVWTIIDGTQYQYVIQPYTDATSLTSLEDEMANRVLPLVDLQGHGFTAARGTLASLTTLGNSRNSPYNTIMGAYDSPTAPEEWAAALGAIGGGKLEIDPARPLHFLKLKDVLPPADTNRFTRAERDIVLFDGIATSITDNGGNVLIERCITTYQTNALGLPDPSYLDVQTLATLNEIRFQYKTRMSNRFLIPRFKLADDTFPVTPGSFVATPSVVRSEIIDLFRLLRDIGLIENLDNFIENLVVERDTTDVNRMNVLLPPDLINQFRVLAGIVQFIL